MPHAQGNAQRGREVFGFETFGNEGFWTDVEGLDGRQLPARLGSKGVEKIWEITPTDGQRTVLDKSAAAVKELVDVLKI